MVCVQSRLLKVEEKFISSFHFYEKPLLSTPVIGNLDFGEWTLSFLAFFLALLFGRFGVMQSRAFNTYAHNISLSYWDECDSRYLTNWILSPLHTTRRLKSLPNSECWGLDLEQLSRLISLCISLWNSQNSPKCARSSLSGRLCALITVNVLLYVLERVSMSTVALKLRDSLNTIGAFSIRFSVKKALCDYERFISAICQCRSSETPVRLEWDSSKTLHWPTCSHSKPEDIFWTITNFSGVAQDAVFKNSLHHLKTARSAHFEIIAVRRQTLQTVRGAQRATGRTKVKILFIVLDAGCLLKFSISCSPDSDPVEPARLAFGSRWKLPVRFARLSWFEFVLNEP